MPLEQGGDRKAVGHNIAKLEHEGYPPKQAEAIALDTARRTSRTDAIKERLKSRKPKK